MNGKNEVSLICWTLLLKTKLLFLVTEFKYFGYLNKLFLFMLIGSEDKHLPLVFPQSSVALPTSWKSSITEKCKGKNIFIKMLIHYPELGWWEVPPSDTYSSEKHFKICENPSKWSRSHVAWRLSVRTLLSVKRALICQSLYGGVQMNSLQRLISDGCVCYFQCSTSIGNYWLFKCSPLFQSSGKSIVRSGWLDPVLPDNRLNFVFFVKQREKWCD